MFVPYRSNNRDPKVGIPSTKVLYTTSLLSGQAVDLKSPINIIPFLTEIQYLANVSSHTTLISWGSVEFSGMMMQDLIGCLAA